MANPLQPKKKSIFAPWVQEIPGVLGDAGDFLGKAGRTANAMYGPGAYGPGAMDYLEAGFNEPAPPPPTRAFGQGGIPENPNPGFGLPGLPGFAKPWVRGQAEALNYLEKNDTDTPVKAAALGRDLESKAGSAKTGQDQAGSTGLTSGAGPQRVGPSQDHATGSGLTSGYRPVDDGRPSLFDAIGINEEGKSRREPDSYVRVKFPGSDQWMEQAPREPDDSRGRSEMDWSKVANPMAFSDYRNRGKRKLMDMQAEDPFVIEREKSRIEDDKANRDAARKVGIYGRQKDIDITNEDNRRTRYQAVYEAKAEELDALMESQKYKKATEQEQERAKAIIEDRYAAQIAAMDKANSKKTERIEAD